MQAAGDLVAVVVEFAAGVKHREHDLCRRSTARVLIRRDTTPVVDDRDGSVDVNRDVDLVTETRERFVDRVVDDFVDKVMQSRRPGRSDVHRGPLTDRFEAFENLYFVRAVVLVDLIRRGLLELYALVGICHSLFFCSLLSALCSADRHTLMGMIT